MSYLDEEGLKESAGANNTYWFIMSVVSSHKGGYRGFNIRQGPERLHVVNTTLTADNKRDIFYTMCDGVFP